MAGRLRKVVRSLTAETEELDAEEMQATAEKSGATTVARCGDRVPVTVLDALTYAGSRESLADVTDAIRLVEGNVTDASLVSRLVADADAVVHFAAETHVDESLANPQPFAVAPEPLEATSQRLIRLHTAQLAHCAGHHAGVPRARPTSKPAMYQSLAEATALTRKLNSTVLANYPT